jgi:hypothetical protein
MSSDVFTDIKDFCSRVWDARKEGKKRPTVTPRTPPTPPSKGYRHNAHRIRELLRQNPDGLTAYDIADELDIRRSAVHNYVEHMPDVYIDRWTQRRSRGPLSAVFVAVEVPPDCPRPDKSARY